MDEKKVMSLLRKEEGRKLDFKEYLDISTESMRKEFSKDVCAIANAKGGRGYIIIGIRDKTKEIVGVKKRQYREEKIQQIVSSRCDPPIPIKLEYVKVKEKFLCVITIYNGKQKPYQLRENGAFYTRRGSTNGIMRKQEIISLIQENFGTASEECPILKSSVDDLNEELINKFLRLQGFDIDKCDKLSILERYGIIFKHNYENKYVVTLGGLLIFSSQNFMYLPHNHVKIVLRPYKYKKQVKIIKGTLLEIYNECVKYLKDVIPSNYPLEALSKGVINAILLRDYTMYDREIDIFISDKSIVIMCPCYLSRFNFKNSYKRNIWIYDKVLTLGKNQDILKQIGTLREFNMDINKHFNKKGKVKIVNSTMNESIKFIYPGLKIIND